MLVNEKKSSLVLLSHWQSHGQPDLMMTLRESSEKKNTRKNEVQQ